jgi:hypothetical protein
VEGEVPVKIEVISPPPPQKTVIIELTEWEAQKLKEMAGEMYSSLKCYISKDIGIMTKIACQESLCQQLSEKLP